MSQVAPPRPPRQAPTEQVLVTPRRYARADGRNRAIYLTFAVLMVLSIYAGRIFDLMVIKGPELAAKGQSQRVRTLPILADRGPIYDSEGAPLAITVESRNITADQTLVKDPAEAAAALAPILRTRTTVLAAERLTGDRRFVYLAKGLTPETWDRIEELDFPGIFSEQATARTYPAGDLAANVRRLRGRRRQRARRDRVRRYQEQPARASTDRGPSSSGARRPGDPDGREHR